jgi:hypothetical protein
LPEFHHEGHEEHEESQSCFIVFGSVAAPLLSILLGVQRLGAICDLVVKNSETMKYLLINKIISLK